MTRWYCTNCGGQVHPIDGGNDPRPQTHCDGCGYWLFVGEMFPMTDEKDLSLTYLAQVKKCYAQH